MNATLRRAFTLIEILVVIAIIGLLIGLLMPAVQQMRQSSLRTKSLNNLRQMAIACHHCHVDKSKMPPMLGAFPANVPNSGSGTLFFHLLPYIEQHSVYQAARNPVTQMFDMTYNDTRKRVIVTYVNPGDASADADGFVDGFAASGYGGNFYVFGETCCETCLDPEPQSWDIKPTLDASFPDGASNTILITEKYARCGTGGTRWAEPFTNSFAPMYLPYDGKLYLARPPVDTCDYRVASTPFLTISAAFADGSARPINPNIKPLAWRALCTNRGGEAPGAD